LAGAGIVVMVGGNPDLGAGPLDQGAEREHEGETESGRRRTPRSFSCGL
jgi:hypothetical protein